MTQSITRSSFRYSLLAGAAAFLLVGAGCSQQPANDAADAAPEAPSESAAAEGPHKGVLQGVITDASGTPLEGAFVKLRDPEQRLLFMVISQDGGHFTAEKLPAGNYEVQGVGGDFESAWSAPIALAANATAETSVALGLARAPDLPPAWPRRASETLSTMDTLPEGEGKNILAGNCVSCHTVNRIAASRKTDNEWAGTLTDMHELMEGSNLPVLSDADTSVLFDYLVANLPPIDAPDPNSRFPRELLTGEARNYRVVQFDIPAQGSEPHDVAVDPWGVGWANQRIGGKISRFDPATYDYSEIGPPLYTRERARPGNLQISRDGMMWLPDPFEIRWVSYDIAAEKWTDYPFPVEDIRGNVQGNSLALHPDGTVWESGPGAARRLNPMTGEWSSWDTPSWTRTGFDPGGYGNTIDGNGRFWLALENANAMARFDGETGEVVEFPLPIPESFPRRMDHDTEGNVWVGLWGAGKFVKIDQNTGDMTLIDSPVPDTGAYALDFDEANNLMWTTLHTGDRIARYNPATGEWLVLPLPQAETDVRRVEVDQNNPNRVWWSGVANNARIGYVELLE